MNICTLDPTTGRICTAPEGRQFVFSAYQLQQLRTDPRVSDIHRIFIDRFLADGTFKIE